jgi:hypothetical protein
VQSCACMVLSWCLMPCNTCPQTCYTASIDVTQASCTIVACCMVIYRTKSELCMHCVVCVVCVDNTRQTH